MRGWAECIWIYFAAKACEFNTLLWTALLKGNPIFSGGSEGGHSATAKSVISDPTCNGVNLPWAGTEEPVRIPWDELKAMEMGKDSIE